MISEADLLLAGFFKVSTLKKPEITFPQGIKSCFVNNTSVVFQNKYGKSFLVRDNEVIPLHSIKELRFMASNTFRKAI